MPAGVCVPPGVGGALSIMSGDTLMYLPGNLHPRLRTAQHTNRRTCVPANWAAFALCAVLATAIADLRLCMRAALLTTVCVRERESV